MGHSFTAITSTYHLGNRLLLLLLLAVLSLVSWTASQSTFSSTPFLIEAYPSIDFSYETAFSPRKAVEDDYPLTVSSLNSSCVVLCSSANSPEPNKLPNNLLVSQFSHNSTRAVPSPTDTAIPPTNGLFLIVRWATSVPCPWINETGETECGTFRNTIKAPILAVI